MSHKEQRELKYARLEAQRAAPLLKNELRTFKTQVRDIIARHTDDRAIAMFKSARAPANRLEGLGIKNKQAAISAVPLVSEDLRKQIVVAILKQKGSYQIRRRQDLDEGSLRLRRRKMTLSGKVKWRLGMPAKQSIDVAKYREVQSDEKACWIFYGARSATEQSRSEAESCSVERNGMP